MNAKHGHTGAKWGPSKASPTYMAWTNAQSKYAKVPLHGYWRGPNGFSHFLEAMGDKPQGTRLAHDVECGGFYWRQKRGHANRAESEQSAPTPEVSGRPIPPLGDGPRL